MAADSIQLKDAAEYEVKRELLEGSYPAYKSFKGDMHAGLMPAALIDDKDLAEDFSSYFFWLFQPHHEEESANEDAVEAFRNDTLLIWFNGGPGVSTILCYIVTASVLQSVCVDSYTLLLPGVMILVLKYGWIDG